MGQQSRDTCRTRLGVTALEAREMPAALPTVAEQVFLERLNDARANPAAYGSAIGVNLSYIAPSAPLAFDTRLIEAARNHSIEMNNLRYFGHTGANGSNPGQRMAAAGYATGAWAESLAAGYATSDQSLAQLIIDAGVPSLGHRHHLLAHGIATNHTDVGVGIVQNGTGPYRHYYSIDSGAGAGVGLTGVAYTDANENSRYDAGEGLGGVTVSIAGVGTTTTWATGGYTFKLTPGTYTVTASGAGLGGTITQQVTVGGANVRLNFRPDFAGPKVASAAFANPASGTLTSVRVTFSEGVNPATFDPTDVTLTGPGGAIAATSVTPVAGTGNTQFDVVFPTQPASGSYTLGIGPDVRDGSGNLMDQNGNGVKGEATDRFTTSAVLPLTSVVVDSSGAGFSSGAGWSASPSVGYFGGSSASFVGAAGANTANFTTTLAAGTYRVSATYYGHANRPTNAAYNVVNAAGATLATRTVNQEVGPNDRTLDGWSWEDVGTITVTAAGAVTVKVGGGQAGQYLDADAVRFDPVSPPPPPPPPGAVTVVQSGGAGFSAGAGWVNYASPAYSGGSTAALLGAAGANTANFTTTLAAGTYRVSATYLANANRPTNAAYAVVDGSGATLATATVNQEVGPNDRLADGSLWEDIGTITVTANGAVTVKVGGGQAGQYLDADAVRFELI